MKYTLLTLLILSLFGLGADAQQNESFKLSTDKPETGKRIHFVYTGIFSKKLDPRITLYYSQGRRSTWMTLNAKYTGSRTEGWFVLPDSVLAFCIKPRNHRDSSELFVFQVYKNGKALKGSYASAASFYGNIAGAEQTEVPLALALYRYEFGLHPDIRADYLLSYFFSAAVSPDAQAIEDLSRTWKDSLQYGKSEQFLTRLYPTALRYKNLEIRSQLKANLLAKYPNGRFAFQEATGHINNKIEQEDFAALLDKLENDYPLSRKSGEFDRIYQRYGNHLIRKGLFAAYDSCVNKIVDQATKKALYASGASTLLKTGKDLEKAEIYLQKSLSLLDFGLANRPPYVFGKADWHKSIRAERGDYLDILAQIQCGLGKTDEAINHLKEALKINDYNYEIRIHYVKYLLATEQYKSALKAASGFVKGALETEEMKQLLIDSYSKKNGSADGAEAYYLTLVNARDNAYKVPKYSRLNIKSIDIKLKDLNGVPFSLSEQRGKSVVLYFFGANSEDEQQLAKHRYFDQLARKYESHKNRVFVAIDKTRAYDTDDTIRNKVRLEILKSYLEKYNLKFRVLLDDYHYNSKNSGLTYFRVADDYSSDGSSQFYLIDKKGMVRYKSYIIPGGFKGFSRDFLKALKIID